MIRKLFLSNFLLAFFFLVYLCALDVIFIFLMNENKSFVNNLGMLISIMPFLGAIVTFIFSKNLALLRNRILASVLAFFILIPIGFVEYLWVATHFHAMLGGKI